VLYVDWMRNVESEQRASFWPLSLHTVSDTALRMMASTEPHPTKKQRRALPPPPPVKEKPVVRAHDYVVAAGHHPRPKGRAPSNDSGDTLQWSYKRGVWVNAEPGTRWRDMLSDREEPGRLEAENMALDSMIRTMEAADKESERKAKLEAKTRATAEAEAEAEEEADGEEQAEVEAELEAQVEVKAQTSNAAVEAAGAAERPSVEKMEVEDDARTGAEPTMHARSETVVAKADYADDVCGGSGSASTAGKMADVSTAEGKATSEAMERVLPKLAARLRMAATDIEWYEGFVADGAVHAISLLRELQAC